MNWEEIAGQEKIKNFLKDSINRERIGHAQLFVGKEGYGTLPLVLAYAKEILNRENPTAATKVAHLNHLDLHFSFPVYSEKNNSLSKRFFEEFRDRVLANPYFDFEDWTKSLESENKQFFISADEIEEVMSNFALKSFEGGTKILIIWRADKMNAAAANKFLKFLEEPPAKTLILLTAESVGDILPTILSRTQMVEIPPIDEASIEFFLNKINKTTPEIAVQVAKRSQGDLNAAFKIIAASDLPSEFEEYFVRWVRDASMVVKNPIYLKNIVKWARDISEWNREKQKNFLYTASEIFRLALLQNYGLSELVYKEVAVANFKWDKFSKFIHGANIESILEEISTADYHLQRNGNSKIIWTDLGIKLSRYIHRKSQ